ncbi:hypothetical protein T492DRAFT_327152 [Pavlovales sp. CCMP2436]|nr:hypothetical protein T492DRAFT_327152 [Pavlovales sp. CCMP2436]
MSRPTRRNGQLDATSLVLLAGVARGRSPAARDGRKGTWGRRPGPKRVSNRGSPAGELGLCCGRAQAIVVGQREGPRARKRGGGAGGRGGDHPSILREPQAEEVDPVSLMPLPLSPFVNLLLVIIIIIMIGSAVCGRSIAFTHSRDRADRDRERGGEAEGVMYTPQSSRQTVVIHISGSAWINGWKSLTDLVDVRHQS